MLRIEELKNSLTSHSLIKLSLIFLFTTTFLDEVVKIGKETLMDKGYGNQAGVFENGECIFIICGALLSQYLISYHESCKSLITQGILMSLPIFFWNEHINELTPTIEITSTIEEAKTKNSIMIFSAAMSIFYGLGKGFYLCGIFSYCSVITEQEKSGRNFGFLWSIWALHGFLTYAVDKYMILTFLPIRSHVFIILFIAIIALSLGNPENECDMLKKIGTEPDGNVLKNSEARIFIPIAISSAYIMNMYQYSFTLINNSSSNPLDEKICHWIMNCFGGLGPIMFGFLWEKRPKKISLYVRILCLLGAVIHFIGYKKDSQRTMAIGYLFLCLTAITLIAIPQAWINNICRKNQIGSHCLFIAWYYIGAFLVAQSQSFFFKEYFWLDFFFFMFFTIIALVVSHKKVNSFLGEEEEEVEM